MKSIKIILSENQDELFGLGLSLEDLQLKHFTYFVEHGETLSEQFKLKNISFTQTIFLLKFIDKYFNGYSGTLKNQLINRLKREIVILLQYNNQLDAIEQDEIIKGILITSYIEDCKYLINLMENANGEFEYKEIQKTISEATNILKVSTRLEFDNYKELNELKLTLLSFQA